MSDLMIFFLIYAITWCIGAVLVIIDIVQSKHRVPIPENKNFQKQLCD